MITIDRDEAIAVFFWWQKFSQLQKRQGELLFDAIRGRNLSGRLGLKELDLLCRSPYVIIFGHAVVDEVFDLQELSTVSMLNAR